MNNWLLKGYVYMLDHDLTCSDIKGVLEKQLIDHRATQNVEIDFRCTRMYTMFIDIEKVLAQPSSKQQFTVHTGGGLVGKLDKKVWNFSPAEHIIFT